MKILVSILLLFQLLYSDVNGCITNTYRDSSLKLTEKRYCCTLLEQKALDLDARSRNGWYRYAIRNRWDVSEREDFIKCLDAYFNTFRETRIGGAI
jgi:hypothetical protein